MVTLKKMDDLLSSIDEIVARLKVQSPVVAVYLFGSFVDGKATERSDIDLAFLIEAEAYSADPFKSSASAHMIAAKIGLALDRQTDVSILNGASLEMAYEIITTGVCLTEVDADKRIEYEISLKGMYFDFKPFLDRLRKGSMETVEADVS